MIPVFSKHISQTYNNNKRQRYRSAVGQINWAASTTYSGVMFDLLQLSVAMKEPKIVNLLHANRVIKKIKLESYSLVFSSIGTVNDLYLAVFIFNSSRANCPD